MRLSQLTVSGVATGVWTQATRTLTTLFGINVNVGALNTSVAAGAVFDFRPAAATLRHVCWTVDSAAGYQSGHYNGSTFVASSEPTILTHGIAVNQNNFGFCYKNNDAAAHNISYSGWDIT